MKKHNLFKIILITLGIIALLTWIIPVSDYGESGLILGERIPAGIWSLFQYVIMTLQYMASPIIFILIVGGFYGVLNKTGVYNKLIDMVVTRFKGREKVLLIAIAILLAIITSFTGLSLALFFIFPFIISVLLILGFDRMSILATTVGSVLVGIIGSTYSSNIVENINYSLALNFQTEIISKIFLFVIALFLLITYILNNQKKNRLSRNYEDPLYLESKSAKKKVWPMMVIKDFILLVMILGTLSWQSAFGIDWFTNAHQAIMNFKVFDIPIFSHLIGNVPAFGGWTINEFSVLILIMTIIMALVYKIKFDNAIDAFAEGAKKLIPISLLVGLVYMAFFITSNHLYYFTIMDWLLNLTKTFNIVTMMLVTIIGSVLTVDITYLTGIVPILASIITDTTVYPTMAILIQSMYGLTMFVAPTSVLLVIGLYYLDIPFITWIKYIYKYIIQLLIVITVILTLIILI